MVRSEEELHVMLNVRGGNGRFSENERAILNERGDNGRCWMWRDDRERVMPGGDMRVRAMLIGERRELRETVILRGEKVDDAVSLLALSLLLCSPLIVLYILTQFPKVVSICLTKNMHTYKI